MFTISPLLLLAPIALLAPLALAGPAAKTRAPRATKAGPPAFPLATYRIAPAPGASALLVRLWTVPRRVPANPNDIGKSTGNPNISSDDSTSMEKASSPVVYDIFSGSDAKGWTYQTSFFGEYSLMNAAPTVRYLNNKTKSGFVFQVDTFSPPHDNVVTLYVFPENFEFSTQYDTRVRYMSGPMSMSYGTQIGFGRDAQGFVQIITASGGYNSDTRETTRRRTISTWNQSKNDWTDGRPVVTITKN